MTYLLVFIGGGMGAAARHAVNIASARWLGSAFPVRTLLVNATGSFLIGLLAAYFALRGDASPHLRLFLTTGVLGGYTTFSAFSLDAVMLWERGQPWAAAGYVFASVAAALLGVGLGLGLIRSLGSQ